MRIASSNVMMASSRYFNQVGVRGEEKGASFAGTVRQKMNLGTYTFNSSSEDMYSLYDNMANANYSFNMKNLQKEESVYEEAEKKGIDVLLFADARGDVTEAANSDNVEQTEEVTEVLETEETDPVLRAQAKLVESYNSIRYTLLSLIMKRFDMENRFGVNYKNGMNNMINLNGFNSGSSYSVADNGQIVRTDRVVTYSESETTSFSAVGKATTEDGRVIEFGIDICMSRSFMEYTEVSTPVITSSLVDPLMINVGADVAQISDQKFTFDLNADGIEDKISMAEKGSGFLAYDINGDGKINDGNELFGTKSGDGFADLAKYDSDGNGWIDENDEIYSKLRVWYKDENGKDVLVNLKEADVGAIGLKNLATEFTLDDEKRQIDGKIRSTGVFLKESGGVGTVQHVDLAVS